MLRGPLLPFSLLLVLAGCGTQAPTMPESPEQPGSLRTFLINSPVDPRLPAPGQEAASTTDTDRALASVATTTAVAAAAPAANPAVYWNGLTRELGVAAKLPPPMFARDYALVQVAIFDALVAGNGAARGRLPRNALAAGAAYEVLRYLFPSASERVTAEAIAQADLSQGPALGAWALGRAVGRLAVRHGQSDGSDAVFTGAVPTGPGIWTGTNPVLPVCGEWKCWFIRSGEAFQPEPPYAYGSPEDLRDVQDVLDASLHRTPEQIEIVHKWADRSPPVIWNAILVERLEGQNVDAIASARALAWLNATLTDAFVSCWKTKYTYWVARPFQRTPEIVTVIPTPNFPSYTSGHSTISAAAAVVLGELFPAERDWFEAQAQEAALSRFWGGIHFTHDNKEGLRVGHKIGGLVADLLREDGRLVAAR